ncbi:MAG: hypothetical protein JWR38_3123 [Mucilaginibacter sp.]|nr:hypothetical protein [Mucilaginibacter sp.]
MGPIAKEAAKYFYKSKYYYKLTWYTFLWVVLFTQVTKSLNINAIIGALLLLIPLLGIYIMVPMGIFYIVQNYKNKEPYNKYRALYLIGHLLFLFILIAIIAMLGLDMSKLSSIK